MPSAPSESADAAVLSVLDLLAERWVLLAVSSLLGSPDGLGFNELGRGCGGASGKVLAQKLDRMERHGMVTRTVLSAVPPRTRYALTPAGFALRPVLEAVAHWAQAHNPTPLDWNDTAPADEAGGPLSPLRLLQQKWVLRIVYVLLQAPGGYNEIGRAVGVNVTTLGHRLRELEAAGLVEKTVVRAHPPQHRYALAPAGAALAGPVQLMADWARQFASS